jgi:glycosyltransferase involved in cell wall biosynthesis
MTIDPSHDMPAKDPRISILYFSNGRVRGGAEEHILTLLRGLDRARFRPYLACRPAVAEALHGDLPSDVEQFPVSFGSPREALEGRRLVRIIRRLKVDILHSHLFWGSLFASPVGWLCRVPVILETPHVREKWRKGWKASFWIDRMAGRAVTNYIAVSSANARYLIEEKRLPARKVVTIANGCDLERFDRRRECPAALKASLGVGADDPVLVVAGRLEPQKGHAVLFDAMPTIRAAFPRVCLVCVGEGSLRTQLEAQAAALGIADSVRFVGYQSNVEEWLALADVTVLPSHYEGLPLVAIESLAAGRPVVATAVDGTPEVVVDGKSGLSVPPGDPQSLANAICRLLADRDLLERMALAGRQWVVDRFSRERQIRDTEGLYLTALENRRQVSVHLPAPASAESLVRKR